MTLKLTLGKRMPVSIRDVWQKETAFSNWLVSADGLDLLASDLELHLAPEPQREVRGDNFPCDIVGRLANDENHVVLIENQFGKTDHDHLGKLLTYAATQQAVTAIWIAEEIADDHRATIDWLNGKLPESIRLYAVELKAYRIGDSPVAPVLEVVCQPNEVTKEETAERTEADAARRAFRRNFWAQIQAAIREKVKPLNFSLQKPSGDHWSSIAVGRSGFTLNLLLTPKNGSIGINLEMNSPWKASAFTQLFAKKVETEQELGRALQWQERPDKLSAGALLEEKVNPSDEKNRQVVCNWFVEWAPRIHAVFAHRVKELSEPGIG